MGTDILIEDLAVKNRTSGKCIHLPEQRFAVRGRPRVVRLEVFEQRVFAERIDEFLGRNIQRPDESQRVRLLTSKLSHRLEQDVDSLLRT